MRNLKRALSLTLASVMLLGMMVVGTSAASFPDVTEKDNVEAIEVLAEVKVLQGYDDGQYHAENPVTRNQMATIICRMMGWRDGDYAGLNPFPDVPDWAANYVAACVANGIVNGRDDGRFHGDDTVTATEAASMMLRALGYTRMPVGADWARAVTQQASKINLFDQLNVGSYTALTRGDVAQLSLNTLQATLVDVEDNTLNISGGTSDNPFNISGGQIKYVVRTAAYNNKMAQAIKANNNTGAGGIDGTTGQTIELGEQVFGGDLKRTETNTSDDFKNPAVRWSYKTKEIGTYAKSADLTYTKEVKLKDIYKDLGLSGTVTTLNFAVDGDNTAKANDGTTTVHGTPATLSSTQEAKIGGKGSVTKVYYSEPIVSGSPTTRVDITVTNYYLAKAVEDYDSTNKEIDVEIKNTTVGGNLNEDTLKLEDFLGISSVKEDDYLVVTVAGDTTNGYDIKTVAPAEVVADVVVTAARGGDYVTAGQKYEYNTVAAKVADDGTRSGALGDDLMDTPSKYSLNDKGYNLYLDPYGYVLGVEPVDGKANVGDYLFIKQKSTTGFDVIAKAVFSDGSSKTITVDKITISGTEYDSGLSARLDVLEFYTFKTDKDGNYELTTVTNQDSQPNARLDDKAQPIRNTDGTVAVPKSANADTVFVAKDKAYVGVKNAPETSTAAPVYYVWDEDSTSRLILVFVDVKGSNSTTADDIVYILNKKPAVTKEGDDTYYTYQAVVDGEKVTEFATVSNTWPEGLYVVNTRTDGRADNKTAVTLKTDLAINAGVVTYNNTECSGGTLTLSNGNGYVLADNVKVRTIDGTTVKTISTSGIKGAVKDGFTQVYVIETSSSDSNISTIYLVKASNVRLPDGATPSEIGTAFGTEDKITVGNVDASGSSLQIPKNKEATFTGTLKGTITSEAGGGGDNADGKVVLDDVTLDGDLNLTGAKGVTGTVTVPDGKKLQLAKDADVEVTVESDAKVEVPKGGNATITFEGTQTEPVKITGTEPTDEFTNSTFKASITEMLPKGGQVDLTGIKSDSVYNSAWGMVNLVIPAGTKNITIGIYDGTGKLVALTGDKTAAAEPRNAMLIGLTTKPLNQGCFDWADGGEDNNAVKAVSLTAGDTYTYKVFDSTVIWGDKITGSDTNYKAAGTFDNTKVILTGEFTVAS